MLESELQSLRIFLVTVILKISQEKHLLSIMCWKLFFGLVKLMIQTEKKSLEVFMKKNCCALNYKLFWVSIPNKSY